MISPPSPDRAAPETPAPALQPGPGILVDRSSFGQRFACGALAALLLLLGLLTLRGFLPALAWALVFAIAVWPLYARVRQRWGAGRHDVLVPGLFTVGVALIFIVPLGLIGWQLGREAHGIMKWIHDAQMNGIPVPAFLADLPGVGPEASRWWQTTLGDPGSAVELMKKVNRAELLTTGRHLGAQIARRLTLFGFTLLTLFFIFRDGDRLAAQLRRASRRAFGPAGERVGLQMVASVHGTVDGLVLVGLAEGLLLGATYALMGVPQPTVFGTLTGIAAMIPFGGPVAVSVAALFLLAKGSTLGAVLLLAVGLAVTFGADHFVRPALIGGATRLPFVWVLLGILGGVEQWGLLGLFLGPATMAALILLWREWTAPITPAELASDRRHDQ